MSALMADEVTLLTFDPDREIPMTAIDGYWKGEAAVDVGAEYLFRIKGAGETHDRLDPRGRSATSSIGRSVVSGGHFDWTDGRFAAPPLSNWVIYELHPGTFAGTLEDVISKLDDLVDIGVNVLELMPVAEFRR